MEFKVDVYAALLEKISNMIYKINVTQYMEYLDILNFWIDIATIIAKNGGGRNKEFLIECADMARAIEEEKQAPVAQEDHQMNDEEGKD